MYIWDGTDRQEGDVEAAFADMVRRTFINRNPRMLSSMKRYVAGCSLALTGRTSAALCAPEPVVQGGFTPSDDERAAMCRAVYASGRDVIHICFRTVEPLVPTGLIVVVYHDGDRVRLHSRTSLVWIDNEQRVGLYGVEDENDQYCHFILRQGCKMKRGDGIATRDGLVDLVEVELTPKTSRRYRVICNRHADRLSSGAISRVVYLGTVEATRAILREADRHLFRDLRPQLVAVPVFDDRALWTGADDAPWVEHLMAPAPMVSAPGLWEANLA